MQGTTESAKDYPGTHQHVAAFFYFTYY